MVYNVNNDRDREDVFGITWGELYGAPGPLRTLARDEELSSEEVEILSAAPVKILRPLVMGIPIPDLLGVGPYIISQRALRIIAEYQPYGVISIPLNLLRDEDGKPVSDYFVLQVRNFIDCIDFERTKFLRGIGFDAAKDSGFRVPYGEKFVLKRSSVGNSHLWRDAATSSKIYFISDELRERFLTENIRGWGLTPCIWSLNS